MERLCPVNPIPPRGHPNDHDFKWEEERILKTLQIIFIESGSGWVETRSFGKKKAARRQHVYTSSG
jgi:hypothetical protein